MNSCLIYYRDLTNGETVPICEFLIHDIILKASRTGN